jgi:hypothetical protein
MERQTVFYYWFLGLYNLCALRIFKKFHKKFLETSYFYSICMKCTFLKQNLQQTIQNTYGHYNYNMPQQ